MIVDFKLGRKTRTSGRGPCRQLALYRAALQPLYCGEKIRASLVYLTADAHGDQRRGARRRSQPLVEAT